MKKLLIVASLLLGCGHGQTVTRIAASVGRAICAASGCPCPSSGLRAAPEPIAYDISPDGGVQAVYR